LFQTLKPLLYEHPNLVLRTATVSPKPIRFAASFNPTGERYIYVNETLCWKSRFPNHQPDLQQIFAQAGTVQSASVVEDRETGRSRGFAFVEMSPTPKLRQRLNSSMVRRSLAALLKVNEAKPREPRNGSAAVTLAVTAVAIVVE
jgi:hypothetical protein